MSDTKRPPKPKSAPPTLGHRSRMANKTNNSMREIEMWVRGNRNDLIPNNDPSRMSGQLSDNVTEERMLKAKLLELGKERYKFLAKSAFEKKTFLEKLNQNSGAMKRAAIDPDYARRLSAVTLCSRMSSARPRRIKSAFVRQVSDVNDGKKDDVENDDFGKKETTKVDYKLQKTARFLGETNDKQPPNRTVSYESKTPNFEPAVRSMFTRTPIGLKYGDSTVTASKTWSKLKKTGPPRIVNDPRYYQLEEALSPVYNTRKPLEVETIVNNIASLHVTSKVGVDIKPKMEIKVQNFMKERGIVF